MMDSESESRRLENDDLRENDGLGWMPGEGPNTGVAGSLAVRI